MTLRIKDHIFKEQFVVDIASDLHVPYIIVSGCGHRKILICPNDKFKLFYFVQDQKINTLIIKWLLSFKGKLAITIHPGGVLHIGGLAVVVPQIDCRILQASYL